MDPKKLSKEESARINEEADDRIQKFQDWLLSQKGETEPLARPERAIVKTFILWEKFYEEGSSGSAGA